jgi:hypothetical protein
MESLLKDDVALSEEEFNEREQTLQEKLISDAFFAAAKRLSKDKEYLEEISKQIS